MKDPYESMFTAAEGLAHTFQVKAMVFLWLLVAIVLP